MEHEEVFFFEEPFFHSTSLLHMKETQSVVRTQSNQSAHLWGPHYGTYSTTQGP